MMPPSAMGYKIYAPSSYIETSLFNTYLLMPGPIHNQLLVFFFHSVAPFYKD